MYLKNQQLLVIVNEDEEHHKVHAFIYVHVHVRL